MNSTSSDDEIVKILQSVESEPMRSVLIQEIRVKFEKIARFKKIPVNDIDDVVSDGIEKLLRKLDKFDGRGSFNGWAGVLFNNHCIDYFRKIAITGPIVPWSVDVDTTSEGETVSFFDTYLTDIPDAEKSAADKERLDNLLLVVDKVITETAMLRRHPRRDEEIARLALLNLKEPSEILEDLAQRFDGLTINAVRIIIHVFRKALKEELEKRENVEE